MLMTSRPLTILMADDDPEDVMIAKDALLEARLRNPVVSVGDGEELMEYLRGAGRHEGVAKPGIIFLDLNMPRKDGREALLEIKSDANLKRIPIVILTTSKAENDVVQSYDLGANSYITKPVTFEGLVEVMKSIGLYWFEIVNLPDPSVKSEPISERFAGRG